MRFRSSSVSSKKSITITGSGYRIGLASGPFLALRAAERATSHRPFLIVEDDAEFLSGLFIDTLGREELAATFRWLGIMTLGELANLPRVAIVSRFGPNGLRAHRLATGEDRATVTRGISPDFAVEELFSPPLENLEQGAFAARSLAHTVFLLIWRSMVLPHIVLTLQQRQRTVKFEPGPGGTTTHSTKRHFRSGVRWQLRAWLDSARLKSGPGIRGGVVRLRIAPSEVSDRGRQLALHEDAHSAAEAHRALIQTQALVGIDDVLMAKPQGGREPDEQTAWYRWGDEPPRSHRDPDAPWPGRVPAPTPVLVPPDPPILEVEWDDGLPSRIRLGSKWVPVLSWAGPWRRVGRWWEGEGAADRYQLVTSAGAFLCEVRDGATYMTGVYD